MKFWYLYKITHAATGKAYVGCTGNLASRVGAHRHVEARWTRGEHTVEHLACAWSKDGAGITEAALIIAHDTLAPSGWNRMSGGFKGYKHHILTKEKISLNKGRPKIEPGTYERTPEWRARQSKLVKEAWANRAHPQLGKPRTDAEKAKQRAAMLGKPSAMKGRTMSAESRAKMSAAKKAYLATEVGQARLRAAQEAGRAARARNIKAKH